jgi:CheY-like chemotaxis protein
MSARTISGRPQHILIVDDDDDDCLLVREAFEESRPDSQLNFVHDGEQMMAYLLHQPPFEDSVRHPTPDLILLDLNMPRMDGREALLAIKNHAQLRRIPVIVLTTSSDTGDVAQSYDNGVNSFITKPASYNELIEFVRQLGDYWLALVNLPPSPVIREE